MLRCVFRTAGCQVPVPARFPLCHCVRRAAGAGAVHLSQSARKIITQKQHLVGAAIEEKIKKNKNVLRRRVDVEILHVRFLRRARAYQQQ